MADTLRQHDLTFDLSIARKSVAQLARLLHGMQAGIVVIGDAKGTSITPVAVWPDDKQPEDSLSAAAESALVHCRGVVIDTNDHEKLLALPLTVKQTQIGAVAVKTGPTDLVTLGVWQTTLEISVKALAGEIADHQLQSVQDRSTRSSVVLDALVAALDEEGFAGACRGAVTTLAASLECRRVSLGFVKGRHCRPVAMSHSAGFGRSLTLAKEMGAAMDEAIEQQASLIYPALEDGDPLILTAQEAFARNYGAGSVMTLPLFVRDRYEGALVAERDEDRPFDQASVDTLASAGALLAPALLDRRENDRWLWRKAASTLARQTARMLGPGHLGRKLALVASIALIAFGWFAKGTYEVVARANVEGLVERAVVAPFDGFIRDATVRAGDRVAESEILATLDDRDLVLKRLNWVTERQQRRLDYERALAERNRAEANVVRAQIEKAEAQIALADEQIARTRLRAPFDGLVVEGDLSRIVGGTVRRGDPLFRLAPLDVYRVALRVDESQIADVQIGQSGQLLLAAFPDRPVPITIDRITPLAEVAKGSTVFRVEAALDADREGLRPGLEGIARVDVDSRPIVWIWSRTLIDWLQISTWAWRP